MHRKSVLGHQDNPTAVLVLLCGLLSLLQSWHYQMNKRKSTSLQNWQLNNKLGCTLNPVNNWKHFQLTKSNEFQFRINQDYLGICHIKNPYRESLTQSFGEQTGFSGNNATLSELGKLKGSFSLNLVNESTETII